MRGEIEELKDAYDPGKVDLETIRIKPYKKDIDVKAVALLWMPYDKHGDPAW